MGPFNTRRQLNILRSFRNNVGPWGAISRNFMRKFRSASACNIYMPIPGVLKFHDFFLQNCSNLSKYLITDKSITSKLYVSTEGENKVFDTDARSRFRFRWNPFVYVSYKVPFRISSICLLIQSSPTFIKCNFTRIVDC